MIHTLVRPAEVNDHQQLSSLLFFETRLHRHLDWRAPLEWLGNPLYWALEEDGQISAALACPFEASGIAWVRLFVHSARWTAANAWELLWNVARQDILRAGGVCVAAIVMQPWFQTVLTTSGFENRQQIVMLEWKYQPWAGNEAQGVRIRPMTESDLPSVREIDTASFPPLWQNPLESIRTAFGQALIATLAEDDAGIIGFQLTTGGGARAHLARLAVHPRAQGRGCGRLLLSDLFARLTQQGVGRLSVNTQNDNFSSLALYQSMGFARTGEQYPVYVFDLHGRA